MALHLCRPTYYSPNNKVSVNNLKIPIVFILVFCLQGCVLSPVERTHKLATKLGFERQILKSADFRHLAYFSNIKSEKKTLHVYLEGDGLPWVSPQKISADPTSRSPVMLPLMAMDNQPAVYIGRPCYLGFSEDPGCNASLWTFSRYSRKVVNGMTEVIQQVLSRYGFTSVRLFGHSGGGTLAVLIARSLPETRAVVTLAGNLDVDAWAEYHHYTPLLGSLNPVKGVALNPAIYQLHLQASNDEVVPPRLAQKWVARQTNTDVCLYPEFDHGCCWGDIWPKVLAQISRGLGQGFCSYD
ncbi:MAG: alpha/beta hydrolase [Thiothrix sp.]|nr:MAG: alpha/beta hydrolase [Thiothrix sp.]